MPTRALSTPAQRATLRRVARELQEVVDSLDGRMWATGTQRQAYTTVLNHLAAWIGWEEGYEDE